MLRTVGTSIRTGADWELSWQPEQAAENVCACREPRGYVVVNVKGGDLYHSASAAGTGDRLFRGRHRRGRSCLSCFSAFIRILLFVGPYNCSRPETHINVANIIFLLPSIRFSHDFETNGCYCENGIQFLETSEDLLSPSCINPGLSQHRLS
jgi:hypothetical protein